EHLGAAGERLDVFDLEPGIAQRLRCAARADQLDAELAQCASELDQPAFVRDGEQRARHRARGGLNGGHGRISSLGGAAGKGDLEGSRAEVYRGSEATSNLAAQLAADARANANQKLVGERARGPRGLLDRQHRGSARHLAAEY